MAKMRSFVYDVEIKPVKIDIETDVSREYTEDGKIKVSTRVSVSDNIDVKQAVESRADGKIKPYGLSTDGAYDVEVKEKVDPSVIDSHIKKAIKKQTKKKAK